MWILFIWNILISSFILFRVLGHCTIYFRVVTVIQTCRLGLRRVLAQHLLWSPISCISQQLVALVHRELDFMYNFPQNVKWWWDGGWCPATICMGPDGSWFWGKQLLPGVLLLKGGQHSQNCSLPSPPPALGQSWLQVSLFSPQGDWGSSACNTTIAACWLNFLSLFKLKQSVSFEWITGFNVYSVCCSCEAIKWRKLNECSLCEVACYDWLELHRFICDSEIFVGLAGQPKICSR